MTDAVERSDDLDRQILAIPADQVFTKRRLTAFGSLVIALLLVLVGINLRNSTETNHAVTDQIPRLERQVDGLQRQVAQDKQELTGAGSAISQLTTALTDSQQQVRDLGGTPKDVVIRTDKPAH